MAVPNIKTTLESAETYDLYVKSLDEIEKKFTALFGDRIRVAIFVYDDDGGRMASTDEPRVAAMEVRALLDGYGEDPMLVARA